MREKSERVTHVAFGEEMYSYCIIFADGTYSWKGMPTKVSNILLSRDRRLPRVKSVSVGPAGYWFILYEDGDWRSQLYDGISKNIWKLQRSGQDITDAKFGGHGTYFLRYDYT